MGEIWSQKALAFCESPIAKAIGLRINNLMFGLNNRFNPLPKFKQKLITFNWRKNMTDTLELAAVIKALRQELINAQQEGTGKDIRFNVNSVEVELETVVEVAGDGKGGFKIRFGVVEANAEAGGHYKNATKQKIKLSLGAVTVTQNPDGSVTTNALQINDKA